MRRDDAIGLLLALVPVLLLVGPWLATGRAPLEGDLLVYDQPLREVLRQAAAEGRWPWWDPTVQSGTPYFANPQTQLLWPATWLFVLLPPAPAIASWTGLHLVLGALGALAWLRRRGLPASAAGLGALVFTLGGPAVALLTKPDKLPAWALLGWMLLGAELLRERRRAPALLLLVGAQAGMLLSGGLENWALGGAVAALVVGGELRDGRAAVERLGLLAASAGAALLVAGVQLGPLLALWPETTRHGGLPYDVAARWSLHPRTLLELVAVQPSFFGQPPAASRYVGSVAPSAVGWGALVAFTAAAATDRRLGRRALVPALGAVVLLLLAFGEHTPVHRGAHALVPGLSGLRYPEKFLWGLWPLVALAAAEGLGALREGLVPRRGAAALGGTAAIACLVAGLPPASVGLGFAGVVGVLALGGRDRPAAALALGLLAAVELVPAARAALPAVDVDAVLASARPVVERAREGEAPLDVPDRFYNVDRHADGATPLPPTASPEERYRAVLERAWPDGGVLLGLAYADGVRAVRFRRQDRFFANVPAQPPAAQRLLLARAGVGRLGFLRPDRLRDLAAAGGDPVPRFEGPLTVLRAPSFRSVGWAASAALFDGEPAAYRALAGEEDLLDRRALALVEGDPGVAAARSLAVDGDRRRPPELRWESDGPEHRRVTLAAAGGWVVLNEAWAPGWTARASGPGIDGVPLPVARADFFLMAVPVPRLEGTELSIELRYRPAGLRAGILASLLGLLLWAGALAGLRARDARPERSTSPHLGNLLEKT